MTDEEDNDDDDDDDEWKTTSEVLETNQLHAILEESNTAPTETGTDDAQPEAKGTGYFVEHGVRRPIEEAAVGWPTAHRITSNKPAGRVSVHANNDAGQGFKVRSEAAPAFGSSSTPYHERQIHGSTQVDTSSAIGDNPLPKCGLTVYHIPNPSDAA